MLRFSQTEERSGYQTAVLGPEGVPKVKAKAPKAKRPTVQQLATQQVAMMDLMTFFANRLDSLASAQERQAAQQIVQQAAPSEPAKPLVANPVLQHPLSSVLPPFQPDALTTAMVNQSQALLALVSQLSQGASDPLLKIQPGASSSVRGSVGRAKLQQELCEGKHGQVRWLLPHQASLSQSFRNSSAAHPRPERRKQRTVSGWKGEPVQLGPVQCVSSASGRGARCLS